ncbi:flagellar hook-associated protein FlgK [Dysosmobacter welbionis]|jgi:flagellar hook-associated protein 1 FlgK|uniref:flagellar hook-associated protein FlgK n=1 Tax=Dysosmobacter welbionis TaxID=2093857 RepID=UPI003078F52C
MSSIGTFGSYTQARLAIYASQAGLSVTGNNIANINTYGYTRQRLEQSSFYAGGADRYYSSFGARTGNGVLCTGVSQLRDPYLDIRYRSQMSNVGAMDAKLGGLEGIQAILDEVSDGEDGFGIISAQLDKMYDALQQLTDQTGHDVYDTQVRAAADALAKQINSYANRLSELYNNTLAGYKQDVETVNNILSNIRDLNASIRKSEIHGDNALELRDERNLLIDQLSEYMKIDVIYTEEDIGAGQTVEKLTIRLGNANPDADVTTDSTLLVDGTYAAQFSMTQVPQPNPNFDPTKPPNGVDNFQYLKPDGSGTNNANLAQLIDSPNFDLTVSELRDSNGRLLYTMEKGRLETITEADYNASGGKATTVTDPDTNVTTITVFTKSGNQYYKQVYTKTPSAAVALDDNDLYGALQSERELLTEAGEYSTADAIAKVDENAAGKRGIPYYQKALDSLAVQLASAFNAANQGFMRNEKGEYIDKDGKPLILDGTTLTTDIKLTDDQLAYLEANGNKVGFNMFSVRGDTDNAEGITASNISVSATWASGEQIISSFVRPSNQDIATTDSTNILHMVALFTTKMDYLPSAVAPDSSDIPLFNGTFGEMWDNIGSVLGHDMKGTSTLLDNYYAASVTLDTSRDSVSGVDLNDEAMNLMQYSKSYNAACRLMTTLDSLLDKLINGTGITT